MNLLHTVMQLDWDRAIRFWLLIGAAISTWESATLLGRALASTYGSKS